MIANLPMNFNLFSTRLKIEIFSFWILGRIVDLQTRTKSKSLGDYIYQIGGIVIQSIVNGAKNIAQVIDWLIVPKGVKIENIWTNYATGTAVTLSCSPTAVQNSMLFFYLYVDLNPTAITAPTYNSTATTEVWRVAGTGAGGCGMYKLNYTTAGSWACTLTDSRVWRAVCYQLSGVNQTTPQLDYQGTSLTTLTMATSSGSVLLSCPRPDSADIVTFTGGETVVSVNSLETSGYFATPSYPTQVTSYTTGTSRYFDAFVVNPA